MAYKKVWLLKKYYAKSLKTETNKMAWHGYHSDKL